MATPVIDVHAHLRNLCYLAQSDAIERFGARPVDVVVPVVIDRHKYYSVKQLHQAQRVKVSPAPQESKREK